MATNSSQIRGFTRRDASPLAWSLTAAGLLVPAVTRRVRTMLAVVRDEALKDGIYLVPVRVFIGLGWLRAFAEKAIEPGWRDGASLAMFLEHQAQADMVVFPAYGALVEEVFLAHAFVLGWIVMLGQLLAGAAIMAGSLTAAALLGGILMNLNFLLAGAPDPSAFYVVIQAVLLSAGAGAVLGVDARLAARIRSPWLVARPPRLRSSPAASTAAARALAVLGLGCAAYATLHIRDWTPGGSVHDPAAVLAVLASMLAAWAAIAALRGRALPPGS